MSANALITTATRVTIHAVNIRDERTISEQVKSGLRLAGWVLLTLAFIYALLISAGFLLGIGEYNRAIYRFIGACGLVVLSTVMFLTVRHWAGWFLGALGYFIVETIVAMLLGSPIARPPLWFIEFELLLGIALLLRVRCVGRKILKIESAGLVGVVLALSFTLVSNSNLPLLVGVAVLGLIEVAYGRTRRTYELKLG